MTDPAPATMRTLQALSYGEPANVLDLIWVPVPSLKPDRIRVKVIACALNPADWAVCQGFFPVPPPRGMGFDVSGTVEALGEGVTGVKVGDLVFGVPDYLGYPTAGASDYAILAVWVPVPTGLDPIEASALPMAVETATRGLDLLGLVSGQTIFINGGGTMTGFAAVQMALMRGAHVIATAGDTFAGRLRALGARVTLYGEGMVERVREIIGGAPDMVLHTAQVTGVLPDLIKIVDGDPRRVMSFSDFDEEGLGVRTTGREPDVVIRYDVLGHFAQLAAQRRFTIPVARTFALDDWREALDVSLNKRSHGKLVILPDRAA